MTKDPIDLMNSFDPDLRRTALIRQLAGANLPAAGVQVNMHLHSFFSFNAQDHSPTRLAWEARRQGLYAAGLCDFDVLDGLEEFFEAGFRLELRTAVALETRAFLKEFAQADINSPGEPGVAYIMGAGFGRRPEPDCPAGRTLADLRRRAGLRNRELVDRINARLPELNIDYLNDVLPLSPGDCPTERHIIRAYRLRAAEPGTANAVRIWARVLGQPPETVGSLLNDRVGLEEALRTRLVKRGGLAYEAPTGAGFPPVDDFVNWVLSARAIPTATWLDGTSAGESDPAAMLECLCSKGVAAVNIVPDRNWNFNDPEKQHVKVDKLRAFVQLSTAMDLPINIGTEMNKEGQPFVDDLNGPVLKDFAAPFIEGARIMVGQSLLARYADCDYCGPRAATLWPGRKDRNIFFAAVGSLPPLTAAMADKFETAGPEKSLNRIKDAVSKRAWTKA